MVRYYFSGIFLLSIAGFIYWLFQPIEPTLSLGEYQGNVNRGAYLARMSGCIACHTDAENGGKALAGGAPLVSDFGTFRAPNITTDKQEGIGGWTIEQFASAVREGISPDGKPYYPAFPYPFYSKLTDQDIADLWAAFQTVPAIAEPDPSQDIGFRFSIRSGVKLWQALYLEPQAFQKDPSKTDSWNRGAYIVEGPAHCGACHTPRNIMGARILDKALQGSDDLHGDEVAPTITASALKEKGWSQDDLAYALQTGLLPDGDAFGGSMAEVVQDGTAFLSWEDLMAMAEYLLSSNQLSRAESSE